MTASSYKKLYDSSVTFVIQKALTARRENEELRGENKKLQEGCKLLKEQKEYLLRKVSILEEQQIRLLAIIVNTIINAINLNINIITTTNNNNIMIRIIMIMRVKHQRNKWQGIN